jgi:chemotaxis protein histidine kinase CheA
VEQDQRLILLEIEEKIDLIFAAIDSLRSVGASGKTRRELLEEIFRNVHSLKASASSQRLEELATLAHEFENLLHSLRSGRIEFDDEIQGVFDETADALFEALSEARDSADTKTPLLDRLRQLSNAPAGRRRAETEILLKALPAEVWQSLNDQERHRLQESIAEGARLYLVSTNFETASFDRQFHDLKNIRLIRSICPGRASHDQSIFGCIVCHCVACS